MLADKWLLVSTRNKDHLYELIGKLPDAKVHAAERYPEFLAFDPFANAPIDDEPETSEEAARVARAKADVDAGNYSVWEEVRKRVAE